MCGAPVAALERSGVFVATRDQLAVVSLVLGVTTVIALSVSDLGVVLGFVGASGGVLISFGVPSACFLKLAPTATTPTAMRVAALGVLLMSIVLLPLAVAIQVI